MSDKLKGIILENFISTVLQYFVSDKMHNDCCVCKNLKKKKIKSRKANLYGSYQIQQLNHLLQRIMSLFFFFVSFHILISFMIEVRRFNETGRFLNLFIFFLGGGIGWMWSKGRRRDFI